MFQMISGHFLAVIKTKIGFCVNRFDLDIAEWQHQTREVELQITCVHHSAAVYPICFIFSVCACVKALLFSLYLVFRRRSLLVVGDELQ